MRKWKCAVLALLSAGVMLTGTAAASADPPKPSGTAGDPLARVPAAQRARIQAQAKARSAAERIRRAAARDAGGFSGIELHGGSVRLWYKGTPPAAVNAAVTEARGTAPVEVMRAGHSLAELGTASARMTAYLRAHPGGPAHRVSAPVNGSGLVVGVDVDTTARVTAALPNVGVPVRVEVQPRLHAAGRWDDVSPYYGGGEIISDEGVRCTAGFGVWVDGQRYLLTAGHCGYPNQHWNTGDNLPIGNATREDMSNDLLLISAAAGKYVFTGFGSSTSTGHVIDWAPVYTGEELCSSGEATTWLCGHVVIDAGNTSYCDYDPWGDWECYSGLVLSQNEDTGVAAWSGDSGGPVMLPTTNGIIAKGTISGYSNSGGYLAWQDFATAHAIWGAVPNV
ncbi:hypothetical protein AB0L00_38030 [Actinoallomurus sp. NPDC052308]|uniref:hypothetical protein n=1 Tax=Actinoallomurus sp. NPDC052308 TaxID=3155530 RepID=UPI003433AEBC